ncbi:chalcone and stilbene synthase-like protein [Streptomyces sp. Ag109_O5-1]|uniref:hypothetical protein n=1 Tax=Streptomyces sp. Ag109_O5-1 TaxID=1938851 RepID=UPI000FAE1150|nr:hypothetical protein [Streptomyces sp. Ag109_O5-1]RPE39772.1 chalcone and stilbene synthase-like protein [Streptomyces sp. Ag109_O5-1]
MVTLASHRVTTDELVDHIRATYRHPDDPTRDHPRMGGWQRIIRNSGVHTRYWSRPLPEATRPTSVGHRAQVAFGDALQHAEDAAQRALQEAGLQPGDIDCIVTSHTTSWAVPNLDVHLVDRLGLRPTVARLPLSTLACSGGVHALGRALMFAQYRPGSRVLVGLR